MPNQPANSHRPQPVYRLLWAIAILAAAGLACSLADLQSGVETSQSLVTQVAGNDAVQTAGAYAKENGPILIETAKALITKEGPIVQGTLESFATRQGPSIQATLIALATQKGPSAQSTLEAFATRQLPGLIETARAAAGSAAVPGQPPADIPIPPGPLDAYRAGPELINFSIPQSAAGVVQFYQREMAALGWQLDPRAVQVSDDFAILTYHKGSRQAVIAASTDRASGQTQVTIQVTK
jgi:hypothetical protein